MKGKMYLCDKDLKMPILGVVFREGKKYLCIAVLKGFSVVPYGIRLIDDSGSPHTVTDYDALNDENGWQQHFALVEDGMTSDEANEAMHEGRKVTHGYMMSDEYVYMKDGKIYSEDGCCHDNFWGLRQLDGWNNDWVIHDEKIK